MLEGVARVVDRIARQHDSDYLALAQVSPIAFLVGVCSGWLTYYVYGWSLSALGQWLGGTADAEKARTVLAWALVPVIAGLGIVMLYVALFNNELFTIAPAVAPALRDYLGIGLLIVQGICSAWALVILSKGLQLIQGFGHGRALVNILLPGILLVGAIMLTARFFNM